MPQITIKDIAKRAGVSPATVSNVINNTRPVSPKLTQRVLKAVERMGYTPNGIARSLRQKHSNMVGLIVPSNSNPFFAEIAEGVEDAGFQAGYSVILCNSNGSPERETTYLDLMWSKRVDGIIMISDIADPNTLRSLVKRGMPMVRIGREPTDDLAMDTIRIDNQRVGYIATRHLIELGHREIACITSPDPQSSGYQRLYGYKQALEEAGLNYRPELLQPGNYRIDGGESAASALLEQNHPFSAVLACNDATAIGAMRHFRRNGLLVPDAISVIGVDDITLASYVDPPLTTVAVPKCSMGVQALNFLVERITGAYSQEPRDIVLDTSLVVRHSCARHPA